MELHEAIRRRRDVRAEFTGGRVDRATLTRLLAAAHAAPSVGHSQPWDFHVIRDPGRLAAFRDHVLDHRAEFAAALPPGRRRVFDPIRIEGIVAAGTGVAVTYDPRRGGEHVLGRATIADTGPLSVALAIQNLWLAATAEGLGVGWVSFYEEGFLADFLGVAAPVRPLAWLCVGPVTHLADRPDLERAGWRRGLPLDEVVHWD